MISEVNTPNFNRSDYDLQYFALFCIAVAGKKAVTTERNLSNLLEDLKQWSKEQYSFTDNQVAKSLPLDLTHYAIWAGIFTPEYLKEHGFGCYHLKFKGFHDLTIRYSNLCNSRLNLRTCTVEELEEIPGIGRKTSRFFVSFTRPTFEYAILDTHILKFMREQGVPSVPDSTPSSGKEYARLEKEFIKLVPPGKYPVEFDLEIWRKYSDAF